jgi:hypothetical protein
VEDTNWEALSAWSNFEPIPGDQNVDQETLFSLFEGFQHTLFDLSASPMYQKASPHRKRLIESFSSGFMKFGEIPYLSPMMDATPKSQGQARMPAASRRSSIHDGEDSGVARYQGWAFSRLNKTGTMLSLFKRDLAR